MTKKPSHNGKEMIQANWYVREDGSYPKEKFEKLMMSGITSTTQATCLQSVGRSTQTVIGTGSINQVPWQQVGRRLLKAGTISM